MSRLIEDERTQIGHDIHDELLPLIFAARSATEHLIDDTEPSRAAPLRQIAEWLDQAMQYGRTLLGQIESPFGLSGNWPLAARNRVHLLYGDAVHVEWQVDQGCLALSDVQATAAYRIVVEAIRNAIGHGKATHIAVTANTQDSTVTIRIVDNGCGFCPDDVVGDHFGLRIMTRRAELAGGKLIVESAPNQSTTIRFVIPMADKI